VGVILLWVWVFPRESQNPILVAQRQPASQQACEHAMQRAGGQPQPQHRSELLLSRPVPPLGSGDGYVWAGVNL
jgi:hypothetical protein